MVLILFNLSQYNFYIATEIVNEVHLFYFLMNRYPIKGMTFHQLEAILKIWSEETREAERIFHSMVADLSANNKLIQSNQIKVSEIVLHRRWSRSVQP